MPDPPVISRPARVLVGWLDDNLAARLLRARVAPVDGAVDVAAMHRVARAAVAARDVVVACVPRFDPVDLPEHLEVDGAVAEVRLVDLAMLCAIQPYVFTDCVLSVSMGATIEELAAVTLPSTADSEVSVEYDDDAHIFRATSPSQNLRVLGEFAGPLPGTPDGAIGVGFLVGVSPSCVRVSVVDGRAFLTDGYHRVVALLAAGIRQVPAVIDEVASLDEVWTPGMLDAQVCCGPRPAFVADFLDDVVAASTALHHVGRGVEVRATEADLWAGQRVMRVGFDDVASRASAQR